MNHHEIIHEIPMNHSQSPQHVMSIPMKSPWNTALSHGDSRSWLRSRGSSPSPPARRAGHSRCYAWRVAMGARRHPRHLGVAGDPGIEIRGSHVEKCRKWTWRTDFLDIFLLILIGWYLGSAVDRACFIVLPLSPSQVLVGLHGGI